MYTVFLTTPALNRIEAICKYNRDMIDQFLRDVEAAVKRPHISFNIPGYKDLIAMRSGDYSVVYREDGKSIQVVAVAYGSREASIPRPSLRLV